MGKSFKRPANQNFYRSSALQRLFIYSLRLLATVISFCFSMVFQNRFDTLRGCIAFSLSGLKLVRGRLYANQFLNTQILSAAQSDEFFTPLE